MGRAKVRIMFYLPDTDLIGTFRETYKRIKQKYNLEGGLRNIRPNIMDMKFAQEQTNLRGALEELVNSEVGRPRLIFPVSSLWGYKKQEEMRGAEIAHEVIESAGHELNPEDSGVIGWIKRSFGKYYVFHSIEI